MARIFTWGALLLVTCSGNPKAPADCEGLCTELQACGFLPSVLGAPSGSQAQPQVRAQENCQARCEATSKTDPSFQRVDDCWHDANADTSGKARACGDFGLCLHDRLPDVPITGLSNLRVVLEACHTAGTSECSSVQSAAVGQDCVPVCKLENPAADTPRMRFFLEESGARRYSEQRLCADPFSAGFENVPAATSTKVGVEVVTDLGCSEASIAVSVKAGFENCTVFVPRDLKLEPCPIPLGEGGAGAVP